MYRDEVPAIVPPSITVRALARATIQFRPGVSFASNVTSPLQARWLPSSSSSTGPVAAPFAIRSIDTELTRIDDENIKITVSFEVDLRLPDGFAVDAARELLVSTGQVPVSAPNSGLGIWSAANEAYGIFRSIAERIGLRGAQPAVLERLEELSNTSGFMTLEAALDDPKLTPIRAEVTAYFLDRIGLRGQSIDKQGLEFALAVGPTSQAHRFVLLADRARGELALAPAYVFVSSLTTAMEVGCYAAWRAANPGRKLPDFNPTDYLTLNGRKDKWPARLFRGGKVFAEHSPQEALACDELWGTRHELLHNGKQLVRVSGSKTNTVPYTDAHATAFRAAVMSLLSWLA